MIERRLVRTLLSKTFEYIFKIGEIEIMSTFDLNELAKNAKSGNVVDAPGLNSMLPGGMSQQMMREVQEAREKKKAVTPKDPIKAMQMQNMAKSLAYQMGGPSMDTSLMSPEQKRAYLKQRLAQRKGLLSMQRANMSMKEQHFQDIESRMTNMMTSQAQLSETTPSTSDNHTPHIEKKDEELTEEERKKREKNRKKRARAKRASQTAPEPTEEEYEIV